MAIYNKNQATVSQNLTKDYSRLSNEDNDVLSPEHRICKQHQIQESWMNIIGLNRPPTCYSHLALGGRVMHGEGREWSKKISKKGKIMVCPVCPLCPHR